LVISIRLLYDARIHERQGRADVMY